MLAAFINSFVNLLAKVQVLDKTTGVAPAALQTCLYPGAATSQLLQAQQLREKKKPIPPHSAPEGTWDHSDFPS